MTFAMEACQESVTPQKIGTYEIVRNLGKGGMGEVFLAKDSLSGRAIALKRIRPEFKGNQTLQSRFLREATVASLLSHPSIVPILSIELGPPETYYTMPYVEGETLRQVLKQLKDQEAPLPTHFPSSIPSLVRLFLQVCEAVAYTHSKGILHRDLKPENIIIGKFGEVMILDWGIANFIDAPEEDDKTASTKKRDSRLTRPGKIAGTLAYMAPERLRGKSSSAQTDIYALGVILYQLLTLQLPFQRKSIASFRKMVDREELIDPVTMAPYRDVPRQLSTVCMKCLARREEERYASVEALIEALKRYIEGKPEWISLGSLDCGKEEEWLFKENVLPARHIAITRNFDVTEWAALMISKESYPENLRLETTVSLGEKEEGLGFLLCVPETSEKKVLEEGYCLWIASKNKGSSKLFLNNVQVLELPEITFEPGQSQNIRIEKTEEHFKLFLNDTLRFQFSSYLPLAGKRIGLLYKGEDFTIDPLSLFDGSRNAVVGCLAVPNAFLSHRLYDLALHEYRRIAQCFSGRTEGREALFRAGLTLLEKAKEKKEEPLFHAALEEFEKLYKTPGAPLEYLGKSLVYAALGEWEEEAKCLELSLRKFPSHPLLPMIKERIFYRIHESALNQRQAAYRIILLAIRHIPEIFERKDIHALLSSLKQNWEPLPFIESSSNEKTELAIVLAFWLKKVPILREIAENIAQESSPDQILLGNALFCLTALEAPVEGYKHLLPLLGPNDPSLPLSEWKLPKKLTKKECRALLLSLQNSLKKESAPYVIQTLEKLKKHVVPKEEMPHLDALEVWCHLLMQRPSLAGAVLRSYPTEALLQETSPLYLPYGTWLYVTKGAKAGFHHFSTLADTPSPPTPALTAHFLSGRIDAKSGWVAQAFWWEKKELQRQLDLFYKVIGKDGF